MMINNKRSALLFIAFILIATSIFSPSTKAEASSTNTINVFLDNYRLTFDVEPRIVSDRTLVPFRKLAESIGIDVSWESSTRSIYAKGNGKDVKLTLDSKEAIVNGENVLLDAAAFSDNGRTLIPLRFFLETFDAEVGWDPESRSIFITSPPRDMYTFSFYALRSFNHRQYVPYFNGVAYGWSSINKHGEFITDQWDNGERQDYFWPGDHEDASTNDIIQSGKKVDGEAYLMVAALKYDIIYALVHDEAKVDTAINKMVTTAVNNNLDGIFIDFEGIRNIEEHDSTKQAFTRFIEKLSVETKKNELKLSIALVPPNNAFSGYDYEQLGEIADFLFLMAYDYNERDREDPHAHMRPEPLHQVNSGIEMALRFIPKEKLVLGVNLVHEDNESTANVIGLAKRHNLKGVGFWLLNRLNDEKIAVIDRTVQLNK